MKKAILSVCLLPSSSAIAILVAKYKQNMSPMIKIILRNKELYPKVKHLQICYYLRLQRKIKALCSAKTIAR